MSAEAVGRAMPAVVTLDDTAAMNAADRHGHRYELDTGGTLWVMPRPDAGHAVIASRLAAWFLAAGWPAEQIMRAIGIRVKSPETDGGRIPDLAVWSRPRPLDAVWLDVSDLWLAVEIVSRGSATLDQEAKVVEYAAAGIPQYWTVARDAAETVTLYRLDSPGAYDTAAKVPLAWLLQTTPADHGLSRGPWASARP